MKNRFYPAGPLLPFALLVSLSLTACSTVNELMGRSDDVVDYKSAQRGAPLSIPPDLTQAAADPRYTAPGSAAAGGMTYSQYQQQADAQAAQAPGSNVLPQRDDMRVERDGKLRWLSIDLAPEAVFPKLVDFWTEQGFALRVNNPRAGIIETDWAENRAKIPESGLRSLVGKVFDNVWDSGERERFRTRIERVDAEHGQTRTEVYLSHEHMVEKRFGTDGAQVRWEPGAEDPELNAAMLARLLVYLGADADRARTLVAQPQPGAATPSQLGADAAVSTAPRVGTDAVLPINAPFERAWRQVGLALDALGFDVEDRDRSAGDFYVRYLDTDTGEQRSQPNFFTRLFGATNRAQAAQYRIHLEEQGGQTAVTILDADGKRDTSATAQRLLTVLAGRL